MLLFNKNSIKNKSDLKEIKQHTIYKGDKKLTPRRMIVMAMLISIALTLSYFERFIPFSFFMPGMKLGLANIVTLVALTVFTLPEMLTIVLLRVIMTTLIAGSGISFFYSLAGGLLSLMGMYFMMRFSRKWFSLIGISVVGAALHNTGQMLVLAVVTGSIYTALWWYPYLLMTGLGTGVMTGFVGFYFYRHLRVITKSIIIR